MLISQNTVVTVAIKAHDEQGQIVEDGRTPQAYLHGHGNVFPAVEAALEGKKIGDEISLNLIPEQAFGLINPDLQITIPKTEFPPGVKVGGTLTRQDGQGAARHYRVIKIKGLHVLLDGNHPLAGQSLTMKINVLNVREAQAEEIAHGHAHDPHGHQH